MRSPSPRILLLSIGLLVAVAPRVGAGGGDVYGTIYPTTASVLTLPMSETVYVPTTYAYTSYSPTSTVVADPVYTTSSYYLPASTYTYSYRSRYVSPRRAARMGLYSPTTYYEYSPVVYSAPLVTTTTAAISTCDASPTSTVTLPPPAKSGSTKPPVTSTPTAPPSAPEKTTTPEPEFTNKPGGGLLGPDATAPKDPVPPAPVPTPEPPPISPPPAPEAKPGDLGANLDEKSIRRNALKPKPGELTMAPTKPPAIIRGRVSSGITGAPIAKAKVILTNSRFANPRSFTSDDLGAFEVPFLPDGDWNLAVEDKDGKAQDYGVLTVSSGRVYDDQGRAWTSFNLSR